MFSPRPSPFKLILENGKERINYKLDHPKAIILLLRERSGVRKLAGIHVPQGTDNRVGNLAGNQFQEPSLELSSQAT